MQHSWSLLWQALAPCPYTCRLRCANRQQYMQRHAQMMPGTAQRGSTMQSIRTWLGALGNLDLQLLSVDQELGGDAEAPAGNLLDAG